MIKQLYKFDSINVMREQQLLLFQFNAALITISILSIDEIINVRWRGTLAVTNVERIPFDPAAPLSSTGHFGSFQLIVSGCFSGYTFTARAPVSVISSSSISQKKTGKPPHTHTLDTPYPVPNSRWAVCQHVVGKTRSFSWESRTFWHGREVKMQNSLAGTFVAKTHEASGAFCGSRPSCSVSDKRPQVMSLESASLGPRDYEFADLGCRVRRTWSSQTIASLLLLSARGWRLQATLASSWVSSWVM